MLNCSRRLLLSAGLIAASSLSFAAADDSANEPLQFKKNKLATDRVIAEYYPLVNNNEWDAFFSLFHQDAHFEAPFNSLLDGIENIAPFYYNVAETFPDHTDTPVEVISLGNQAAVRLAFSGTTAWGVPVTFEAVDWFKINKGKIAAEGIFFDIAKMPNEILCPAIASPPAPGTVNTPLLLSNKTGKTGWSIDQQKIVSANDVKALAKNLKTIDAYYKRVNNDQLESFYTLFADDVVFHGPGGFSSHSKTAMQPFFSQALSGFPHHRDTPQQVMVSGQTIAVLLQFTGTDTSGNAIAFNAVDWFQLDNGVITSLRIFFDLAHFPQSLAAGRCQAESA
ncbi:ketosteroid isomerase-like protein [Sinobacterium caligoides]|uniref:Ketosteroid isomerase-like protein n=1 Tax=Sinobacterium caligoides TaxID=933926 RepID=A0A3N2DND3_9GAMM|nr:nuclear transport factor 2 family protein [Sinobacterium caligoides]ROS01318.1 ketosteroid isomerase-like protein [Sinobacterium caligoides]